MSALPVVTTAREYGARGHAVTLARHGKRRMDAWARTGGRRKNPTLAEIETAEREAAAAKARRARAMKAAAAAPSVGLCTTGVVRARRSGVGSAEAEIAAQVAGASNPGPVGASSRAGGGVR